MPRSFMRFFLGIYVFLYIFNPTNFLSFNLIYLLFLVAATSVFFNVNFYFSLLKDNRIFAYVLFLFYIVLYLLFFGFSSGSDAVYMAYTYLLSFFSLVCCFFIVFSYSRLYNLSFQDFFKFLVSVGVLQLFFVIVTLLSPDFRELLLITSRVNNLWSISNDYGGLRSYGLANGYTSTFPMLMGVYALFFIAIVSRTSVLNIKYYWFLLLLLLFIFSVIINARIGLVPVMVFFVLTVFSMAFHGKSLVGGLKLFLFSISGFLFLVFVDLDLDKYMTRLIWGVEEVMHLIGGERVGTFQVLEEMLHFPKDTMSFLFGTGLSVFGDQENFSASSDIGFVRDVYMIGALNTVVLVVVVFYLTGPLRQFLKISFGLITLFSLFIALVAYYFKGAIWASSEVYNFIVLLSVFSIYLKSALFKYEKNSYN